MHASLLSGMPWLLHDSTLKLGITLCNSILPGLFRKLVRLYRTVNVHGWILNQQRVTGVACTCRSC